MKHTLPCLIAASAVASAVLSASCNSASASEPASPTQLTAPSRAVPAPANGRQIPLRVALPELFTRAAVARRVQFDVPPDGTPTSAQSPSSAPSAPPASAPSTPAAFTLDGIDYLPLGIQTTNDGDWYVQCAHFPDGHTACFRIIEAKHLRGLQLSTTLANDHQSPLVFFMQTARPTSEEAERQSLMMSVFTKLYGEVIADIQASASAPRARAPGGGTKKSRDASGGSDAEPDPAGGDPIPVIDVPGTRPGPDPFPILIPTFGPYAPPAPSDPPSPPRWSARAAGRHARAEFD